MTRRLLTDRGVREVITDRDATSALEERIAEHVWAFYAGQHAEAVAWLERLGCKVVRRDVNEHGAEYILDGLVGVRVGLVYPGGDPISVAVQFGFAIGGGMWAAVYGGMMDAVKHRWQQERYDAQMAKFNQGVNQQWEAHGRTAAKEGKPRKPHRSAREDEAAAWLRGYDEATRGPDLLACTVDADGEPYPLHVILRTATGRYKPGAAQSAQTLCAHAAQSGVRPASGLTYTPKVRAANLCESCTAALPHGWPDGGHPDATRLTVN